jgi:hypothetical protein
VLAINAASSPDLEIIGNPYATRQYRLVARKDSRVHARSWQFANG